jgi:hypothetical protein
MYGAEDSYIKKLLKVVLVEESNVEVGYESDLWSYRHRVTVWLIAFKVVIIFYNLTKIWHKNVPYFICIRVC